MTTAISLLCSALLPALCPLFFLHPPHHRIPLRPSQPRHRQFLKILPVLEQEMLDLINDARETAVCRPHGERCPARDGAGSRTGNYGFVLARASERHQS